MGQDGSPSSRPRLRVAIVDAAGRPVPARGLAAWLARIAPARARGTVTIALVSDARVRALNRQYRGIDAATDVLSFPAAPAPAAGVPAPGTRPPAPSLGDIVIAKGFARRQARAEGHSEATELRVLALHGLLHLLGHDHERDSGAMRRLETRLRRAAGLERGLIERGTRS
jgi:probable rRNA maturation factor